MAQQHPCWCTAPNSQRGFLFHFLSWINMALLTMWNSNLSHPSGLHPPYDLFHQSYLTISLLSNLLSGNNRSISPWIRGPRNLMARKLTQVIERKQLREKRNSLFYTENVFWMLLHIGAKQYWLPDEASFSKKHTFSQLGKLLLIFISKWHQKVLHKRWNSYVVLSKYFTCK